MSSNGFSALKRAENLSDRTNVGDEYNENQLESYKILHKRKQPLLPDLDHAEVSTYFVPSNVMLKYLDLFDSLVELLLSLHPPKLVKMISNIMASDSCSVSYFTHDFVERLKRCTSISSVMKVLFPYTNWYDHSFIRELVDACNCPEGVKLLDQFDSRIDVTLPITSYPVPAPSSIMLPDESSTHTVMVVRCEQQLSSMSLQHVKEVKSFLVEKFGVTKHAFVLLAVANRSSAMLFWLIPRKIVSMITISVQEHSATLYERGLLEVAIYPNFSLSTGSISEIWKMAFFRETDITLQQVR